MNLIDKKYIKRCFELAQKGLGSTSPNPLVGSVVVYNERIIGEGYHHKCGEAHAEINALNSVKERNLLPFSTTKYASPYNFTSRDINHQRGL